MNESLESKSQGAPDYEEALGSTAIHESYILTLEDDELINYMIETSSGLKSRHFDSIRRLLGQLEELHPVAVFVDIHLTSGECGIDAIPILRSRWPFTPIIVVTADPTDDLLADALASGADDFIRKPISSKELLARLQARLKSYSRQASSALTKVGDLKIDRLHQSIEGPTQKRVQLTASDLRILQTLADAQGTLISRNSLKRSGWAGSQVSDKALDRRVHILRRALAEVQTALQIKASYGEGFRLCWRTHTAADETQDEKYAD